MLKTTTHIKIEISEDHKNENLYNNNCSIFIAFYGSWGTKQLAFVARNRKEFFLFSGRHLGRNIFYT
jgi:hypothetical protein